MLCGSPCQQLRHTQLQAAPSSMLPRPICRSRAVSMVVQVGAAADSSESQ